jgi:hypothetical protein
VYRRWNCSAVIHPDQPPFAFSIGNFHSGGIIAAISADENENAIIASQII